MKYQIKRLLRLYNELDKQEKAIVLTILAFIGIIILNLL
jgi:hypothetical protein